MIDLNIKKRLKAADGQMLLDVQFQVKHGDFIALFGPSGAGKTSILRMLAGLMLPDEGRIEVEEEVWWDSVQKINKRPQHRSMGFVFQDYALFPNMTVRENLLYALSPKQDSSIVNELIEITQLGDLQHRKPNRLSGGQQQRAALARALVRKPKLLLLDEPLSALDFSMRNTLQTYLLEVHKTYSLTTILVSHDLSEVVKLADKLIRLENGKVIHKGKPYEVFMDRQPLKGLEAFGEVINLEIQGENTLLYILVNQRIISLLRETKMVKNLKIGDKILLETSTEAIFLQKITYKND